MMDYGMGWGMGWGWLGMTLFWLIPLLVVIVLAAVAVKYLFSGSARSTTGSHEDRNRALEVLEERYARGEINREEYLQKRDDLKRR
ncbi:membrane protein [Sulfuricaulis limicola]|uniref:Membrane protein n=1 Tax=Sulfuricaulis limicola TaxID=1620215 RepID=A0A1B4XEN0_9GAMM|nr:SHOCT domain-containing protein [Sulfuricaulis limicola]BAV33260.1 membrane protein [Sulfuricaulis limicola]